MDATIYIVEDDNTLCRELARILELQGYEVRSCADGEFARAAELALEQDVDMAIVDLALPDSDGHAICRDIRRSSNMPIMVLTSSTSEFDEVMSINLGADDYVSKPYRPSVLLARVQALLRRANPQLESGTRLEHGGVVLDIARSQVSYRDETADIGRNEMRILRLLMMHAGRIVTRQDLMCEIWDSDEFIDDNTLTVNVNRLRHTLGSIGVPEGFLITRRGQGYQVLAPRDGE